MIRGSPFRSLNHVSGNAINPPWPMALPLMPSIYFRFRRHSDHYSMLARNAPVANDPNVWSGRASQEIFIELVVVVLHQCIRPLLGAFAPGHHGYQRACDLISGQA
jgi:hypothetical protein